MQVTRHRANSDETYSIPTKVRSSSDEIASITFRASQEKENQGRRKGDLSPPFLQRTIRFLRITPNIFHHPSESPLPRLSDEVFNIYHAFNEEEEQTKEHTICDQYIQIKDLIANTVSFFYGNPNALILEKQSDVDLLSEKVTEFVSTRLLTNENSELKDSLLAELKPINTNTLLSPLKVDPLLREMQTSLEKINQLIREYTEKPTSPDTSNTLLTLHKIRKQYVRVKQLIQEKILISRLTEAAKQAFQSLESCEKIYSPLILDNFLLWVFPFATSEQINYILTLKSQKNANEIRSFILKSCEELIHNNLEQISKLTPNFREISRFLDELPYFDLSQDSADKIPSYAAEKYKFLHAFFKDYTEKIQLRLDLQYKDLEEPKLFLTNF